MASWRFLFVLCLLLVSAVVKASHDRKDEDDREEEDDGIERSIIHTETQQPTHPRSPQKPTTTTDNESSQEELEEDEETRKDKFDEDDDTPQTPTTAGHGTEEEDNELILPEWMFDPDHQSSSQEEEEEKEVSECNYMCRDAEDDEVFVVVNIPEGHEGTTPTPFYCNPKDSTPISLPDTAEAMKLDNAGLSIAERLVDPKFLAAIFTPAPLRCTTVSFSENEDAILEHMEEGRLRTLPLAHLRASKLAAMATFEEESVEFQHADECTWFTRGEEELQDEEERSFGFASGFSAFADDDQFSKPDFDERQDGQGPFGFDF